MIDEDRRGDCLLEYHLKALRDSLVLQATHSFTNTLHVETAINYVNLIKFGRKLCNRKPLVNFSSWHTIIGQVFRRTVGDVLCTIKYRAFVYRDAGACLLKTAGGAVVLLCTVFVLIASRFCFVISTYLSLLVLPNGI